MFMPYLVLAFSLGLFCFYLQSTCQRILRREFEQDYFQSVVRANRLGFPYIRAALQELDRPMEYSRFRTALKCDFLTLAYVLKHAGNAKQRYSAQDRLLMLYFRCTMFSLYLRHTLRLPEKPVILKLTAILKYFANVVGQRVSLLRFGNLSASEYLQTL